MRGGLSSRKEISAATAYVFEAVWVEVGSVRTRFLRREIEEASEEKR